MLSDCCGRVRVERRPNRTIGGEGAGLACGPPNPGARTLVRSTSRTARCAANPSGSHPLPARTADFSPQQLSKFDALATLRDRHAVSHGCGLKSAVRAVSPFFTELRIKE